MKADDAKPGDVVLDGQGACWLRGEKPWDWSTFGGPVLHYGEWKAEYGPQGELVLLVRAGGRPPPLIPAADLGRQ